MMSSEIHVEDAVPLQAEGVAVDVYGWFNLHKLSMCLAAAYAAYYLLVIVRVSPVFVLSRFVANIVCKQSRDCPALHRQLPSVSLVTSICGLWQWGRSSSVHVAFGTKGRRFQYRSTSVHCIDKHMP